MLEKPNQKKQAKKPLILPPGTPIEIRAEEDGFTGSWYEATVIKPLPNPNFQIFEFNGNVPNPNIHQINIQNPNFQKNPNDQNPNFQDLIDQNPNLDNPNAEKSPTVENPKSPDAEKSRTVENPKSPDAEKSRTVENPNNPDAEKSLTVENPNGEKSPNNTNAGKCPIVENHNAEKSPNFENLNNPNNERSLYIENPNFENLNYDELYYEIEYKSLLCEDEKTLLKEGVKATNIRPNLPKIKHDFKLNDVVEAFYLDGWWIGIITQININNNNYYKSGAKNDDQNMYEVTFTNPPNVIEFKGSEIRLHFDWIDGKWFRPIKMMHGTFGICEDETIASMISKGKSPKIQSKSSLIEKSKAGLDIAERQERDLITSQVINQSRSGKKNKRKQFKILGETGGGTDNGLNSVMKTPLSRKETLARRVPSGTHSSKRRKTQKADSSSVSNNLTSMEKGKGCSEVYCRRKDGNAAGNQQSPSSNSSDDSQPPSSLLAGIFLESTVQDLPDSTTANGSSFVEQAIVSTAVVEGNQGEVTNPNKELESVEKVASVDRNDDKSIDTVYQDFESAATLVADTAVEVGVIDSNNEKGEMKEQVSVVEGNDKSIDCNYQDLESAVAFVADTTLEVGVIDPNNEKGEMEEGASAVEGNANPIDSDDQSLPFGKTLLPVWKAIESLEAFEAIPQKPHFQKLVNDSPASREINAIGHMPTFSRVAKKITELEFDDPIGSIEDCLKDLVALEENGFDVNAIRDRVSSLLSKKDEHDNLLNQLKEYEQQLVEHNCEKGKILEEIGLFDKQLKEVQEKKDSAFLMREDVETKIMCLELKLKSARQAIDNICSSEKAAAFP